MSVAKAYSIGVRNVVATFGAKVSEGQIALLREYEKVIVWFDADPAGMAGERRLLEGLHRHTETFRVTPTKGKDMADLVDLDEFARYTMFHTMPGSIRLGEIDHARRFGYG
jgi:DNA primase